jgi:hypothetical protein
MGLFSVQVFNLDMHNYPRVTLIHVLRKKICEGQTLGKLHLGCLLENSFMHLTVSFNYNLKVNEGNLSI